MGGSHADFSCSSSSSNTKLPAVRALNRDQTARRNRKGSAVSFSPHRTVLLFFFIQHGLYSSRK